MYGVLINRMISKIRYTYKVVYAFHSTILLLFCVIQKCSQSSNSRNFNRGGKTDKKQMNICSLSPYKSSLVGKSLVVFYDFWMVGDRKFHFFVLNYLDIGNPDGYFLHPTHSNFLLIFRPMVPLLKNNTASLSQEIVGYLPSSSLNFVH